jgi:peptide-methionine (R)-S-oxide reductase
MPGHSVTRRITPLGGLSAALSRPYAGGMETNTPRERPTVTKSDEQWRSELSPQEYHVLREAGTEKPWTGEYWDTETLGVYSCRACGAELFRSETKFDGHCGWPSFYEPSSEDGVVLREDTRGGMLRTEVLCATCLSHLGHVFHGEGFDTPTDQRYCINSISLRLEPREGS